MLACLVLMAVVGAGLLNHSYHLSRFIYQTLRASLTDVYLVERLYN